MTKIYESFANPGIEEVSKILNLKHELLQCNWLVGKSAAKEGISRWDYSASLGRSYENTAAVWYDWHVTLTDPPPIIVIPTEKDQNGSSSVTAEVIIHELGHVLHKHLDLEWFGFAPVSRYATTCWMENFAESFTSWLVPRYMGYDWIDEQWKVNKKPCEEAVALFESLNLLRKS